MNLNAEEVEMKSRTVLVLVTIVLAGLASLAYLALHFNLSALQMPSKVETYVATKAKHWLVARAVAREMLSPEPGWNALSVARGQPLYDSCCSMGAESTDIARSIVPGAT